MEQNSNFIYAGDLTQELEVIEQLISSDETVENQYTYTLRCDAILTIKCC